MSNTVEPEFQKEINKRELKIQHYRQKCAELQEANADLRVELTLVTQDLEEAHRKLAEESTPHAVDENAEEES